MNLRNANSDDIEKIAHLHAKSWQENYHEVLDVNYLKTKLVKERVALWTERLNNPAENQLVLIIEQQGVDNIDTFCGFICVYGDHHKRYGTIIDNLHIVADYKGQRLGTQLISAAAEWAYKHHTKVGIYLEVLECNHKARGFYQSLGAKNEATAYWHTPCNNKVKEFIYTWSTPEVLI
ncbi:MAG: ribosomal protein S18 acetylase RimI-like enzyme [Alteromonadaceae bacterium]|jgi:ribosomal protein S18 acetylase RimI-like enzyme